MYGRNGESPLPILATSSPSDCFDVAIEAWRIAVQYMVPVIILSDGYIANGAEPWLIPDVNKLPRIKITHPGPSDSDEPFLPYQRNGYLARPWALPGTKGLMHRLGGLEKEDITGNVSYDPDNHQHMVETRAQKVKNIAKDIPPQHVDGSAEGDLLVLSWGGTYGACTTAVTNCRSEGLSVSHAHLRYLNPFPANLEEVLGNFKQVLIPELNTGQLQLMIRTTFLRECEGLNKIKGRPFSVSEIKARIKDILE
jgi:2-oxoglutarate ferredoxin oxidoreductase subunit alpha